MQLAMYVPEAKCFFEQKAQTVLRMEINNGFFCLD